MLEQGLRGKKSIENLIPIYLNSGDKDTHAYQNDQYLSHVRSGSSKYDYGCTHQDPDQQFERPHWPTMEWVCKCENQKNIACGEKDAAPKRELGEE